MKFRRFSAFFLALLLAALCTFPAGAVTDDCTQETNVTTILFTHDLHSHFLPQSTAEGGESGGYARLKTVIDRERAVNPDALLVDGGDFSIGSLIQTLYTTQAAELRTMGAMGYDAVTIGNHEFDHKGTGFAEMLNSAKAAQQAAVELLLVDARPLEDMDAYKERFGPVTPVLPMLLEANYAPADDNPDRAFIRSAMENYGVTDCMTLERGGVTYGLFGLMGVDSDECAPTSGFTRTDAAKAAKRCVETLKGEGAEIIVCLSHSGTGDSLASSEDEELAKAVDGIDVIVSFILYVRLFTSPLTQIAQGMTNLQTASASAHRIFDFLESEELGDESDKTEKLDAVRGAVTFDHVRFSYPDSPDKIIIKDFSAEVHPGQKVAIVGPTGAGKTTMVNLLMRFFEVNSGRITIDGVATTDLRREDVHELFGMVLQDTWLFEGTIRENLVYNMEGITDEQLETVCKACGLDKFVHSLPQGFDTVLSESTTISAGQKQLLTIARAMLQNAPMLILDEATSSVDTRTELLIQRAMDELTKGRTSFVIAHRLSTIKNADLILVMRDGDVIESGTHEQLMEQNGFYAELYNSQFAQAS